MNNVQHLLDTLGPPPAEVCLDWAWQLVGLADQSDSPVDISWSMLQVDQSGQLSFDRSSQDQASSSLTPTASSSASSEIPSISQLVQQLLSWSEDAIEPLDSATQNSIQEHRQSLNKALLAMKTNVGIGSLPIDMESEPVNSVFAASPLPKQRNKKQNSNVLLWVGLGTGLATVAVLGMFLWPSNPTDSDANLVSPVATSKTAPVRSTVDSKGATKKPAGEVSSVDESADASPSEGADSDNEITTLQAAQAGAPQFGLPEETLNSLTASAPANAISRLSASANALELPKREPGMQAGSAVVALGPESLAESPASGDVSETASSGSPPSSDSPSNAIPPNALPLEDVTSMLAEAAKADPKVNNVDAAVDDTGIPQLPVQLLEIESMLQVQEISAKIRVRQPVWQLRIASTEAFTVDPPGMQSLAEKETVRWTLTATEMKPRKDQEPTQVFVFAQLSGRRADIKWKIAAGCADLPAIAVPLNEERLDAMLDMLQAYQQRLSTSVASIKDTLELPGMPREYKSVLTAQRKAMENEGKLAARARQIIADAGMFVGWLDRTIEMHGNLTDQVAGQSVTTLQIGQPELPKVEAQPDEQAP